MKASKIGTIVTFTKEQYNTNQTVPSLTDYPAIVYKVYDDPNFVGLYVFTDHGMVHMRYVPYSAEQVKDSWR